MGFKGSVESFSLADVFQNLAMNQQTGTLRVFGNGTEEKNVFFQNGQVRHLSRGSNTSLLPPDVFVARGLVTQQQIEAAIERQRETGKSVGACLIDLGQINEVQHDDITRHQIEEEIYDLFGWDHASFEFSDGAPSSLSSTGQFPATGPTLPISHLIMEAARRVDEWERLRKLVPSSKEIYAMDLVVRKAVEKGEMEMDPVEKRVATLIDGARDVDDIIVDSALFKFEVWSALGGFVQSSLIRPAKLDELRFAEAECAHTLPKRRIKILERILAAGGENTKIRMNLAELLATEGDIEHACIHFSALADAELQANREHAALEMYKRILAISPKHVKSHEQLAAIYSKLGKRREAFMHYQELFETFREQNHLREARVAGACALECDPAHSDLRNSLIELLLADNQKEVAAQQLELMGDQAAKTGNIKLASDSYRRAMQCRPGNNQLKKKLADTMLTKEDRRSRKQRTVLAIVVLVILSVAGGGLALLEGTNTSKYNEAETEANKLIEQAKINEESKRYPEAQQDFQSAVRAYASISNLFSPILNLNKKAMKEAARIQRLAMGAGDESNKQQSQGERQAQSDLESANAFLASGAFFDARDGFDRVLKNQFAADDVRATAHKGMEDAQAQIKEFDEGKARMKEPPGKAFGDVDTEARFKKAFYNKFGRFLGLDELKMPVLISPNTNNIQVFLDDGFKGEVNVGVPRELNTFRYPWGPHRFKFTKPGFVSCDLFTSDLHSPIYNLELERKPAVRIDLHEQDQGIQLSGEAVLNGDSIYIGTNNGSLIEIGDPQNPIKRRYNLPPSASLNRDVFGQIYVYKRDGNKPDLIAYATREGECVGVEVADDPTLFNELWHVKIKANVMLEAPPTVVKIPLLANHPIMTLPSGRDLYLVDCEDGGLPFGGKLNQTLPARISSSVTGIENNSVLVMGCSDGSLYGVDLGKETVRTWPTDSRGAIIRGCPTIVDDKIVVGAGDGKLYIFNSSRPGSKYAAIELADSAGGAGSIDAQPLIVKEKIYIGSAINEGFYCVDLAALRQLWHIPSQDMGTITKGAAVLGNLIFFGTDTGKLFCIDAEHGQIRWVYQMKNNKPFASAPIVIGKHIYCFSTDGLVLGFDEQ